MIHSLKEELKKLKTEVQSIEKDRDRIAERNEELQSQISNSILKNSQLTQIKNEQTQKIKKLSQDHSQLKALLQKVELTSSRQQQKFI